MSLDLSIWKTGDGAYTDYTNWMISRPSGEKLERTHELNQPRQLTFYLASGVASFALPEAGNRVRVRTATLATFFTGYLTKTPKATLLGADASGNAVYGYECVAVDESLKLEWGTATLFPTLPPFVNKYQGEIVSELIALLGSSLTTTNVDDGILIPYFRVKPEEGFWDAVRRLSDQIGRAHV